MARVTQAAFVNEPLVRYRGDLSQAERRIVSRRIAKYYFNLAQIARKLGKTEHCKAMLSNARQFDPFRIRYIKLGAGEWIRRTLES